MSANTAKYRLYIAGFETKHFEVTSFTGEEQLNDLYRFNVWFKMSDTAADEKTAPPDNSVIGKDCRIDIDFNGEVIPYCGIVTEFYLNDHDGFLYHICLTPRMYRMALNYSSRVFRNLSVPEIIKKVIEDTKPDAEDKSNTRLSDYFKFDLESDVDEYDIKYPKREFCVQYRENDFSFISRLMEESGIVYYFNQVKDSAGTLRECAMVTDKFLNFPLLNRTIPFMRGSGLAEISGNDNIVESVNSLSSKTALMSKNIRVRAYNHRTPEAAPEGTDYIDGGHYGNVYEYGGPSKNSDEAKYRAHLYASRLWVKNNLSSGKSNSPLFRAGLRVPVSHSELPALSGNYLLISVRHQGGWYGGAYSYINEFDYVRAEPQIYAPDIITYIPRIDGVTTALVGATGDSLPTLNEYGNYNVNMPFMLEGNSSNGSNAGDYGASKHIRVAQPSSGIADGEPYGIHFPVKRGAEMVLAYVDGDPNRPVGLGFVPNAAAPSVARNVNNFENVMRSWGGNQLVMTDTEGDKSIKLVTPEERCLEMHDGNKNIRLSTPDGRYVEMHDEQEFVKIKSANSESFFNDKEKYGEINIAGHRIHVNYADGKETLSIQTAGGNLIQLYDPDDKMTFQNKNNNNKIVFDGKNKSISLDSSDNTVVLNGKDKKITITSADSKGVFDGKGKKVIVESKGNKIVLDGSGACDIDVKKNITLKAGGQLVIDAKKGIANKGQLFNVN